MSPNPWVTRKCLAITEPALSNAEGPNARFAHLPPFFGGLRGKEGRTSAAGVSSLEERRKSSSASRKSCPVHHPPVSSSHRPQQEFPIIPQQGARRHGALRGADRRAARPPVSGREGVPAVPPSSISPLGNYPLAF